VKHFASSLHQRRMQVGLFASVSNRSRDLVHSGWKSNIISCTGEKKAQKLLFCTYALCGSRHKDLVAITVLMFQVKEATSNLL